MKPVLKLKKEMVLFFVSRNETEEIVKSSNNRENGMIRTYNESKKREKDYSVNFILSQIEDGLILIKNETSNESAAV